MKFVKVNEPKMDPNAERFGSEFASHNLAITADGVTALAEMNANALREALLNSPELLKLWGYKLVKITEAKPKAKPKAEEKVEVEEDDK